MPPGRGSRRRASLTLGGGRLGLQVSDTRFSRTERKFPRHFRGGFGSRCKCNTCYGVVAMGQCYGQLSLEERAEIYRLRAGGISQHQIASGLGRAASTLSRELKRNSRTKKVW